MCDAMLAYGLKAGSIFARARGKVKIYSSFLHRPQHAIYSALSEFLTRVEPTVDANIDGLSLQAASLLINYHLNTY